MAKRGFSVTAVILAAIPFALGLLSLGILALASVLPSSAAGIGWFGVAGMFLTGIVAAVLVPISAILAVIAIVRGDKRDRVLAIVTLVLDIVLVIAAIILTFTLS